MKRQPNTSTPQQDTALALAFRLFFGFALPGHNLEILQDKLKRFLFGLMSLAKCVEPGLHSTSFFRSMTENRTNTAFLCH